MGHQHAFPRPGPNGRCRFGHETFAGFGAMGRDAPRAVVRSAEGSAGKAGPERTLTNSICATARLNDSTFASALEKIGAAA